MCIRDSFQGLGRMRERVAEESKDKESIPIFNKRLFASHGSVVITAEGMLGQDGN